MLNVSPGCRRATPNRSAARACSIDGATHRAGRVDDEDHFALVGPLGRHLRRHQGNEHVGVVADRFGESRSVGIRRRRSGSTRARNRDRPEPDGERKLMRRPVPVISISTAWFRLFTCCRGKPGSRSISICAFWTAASTCSGVAWCGADTPSPRRIAAACSGA